MGDLRKTWAAHKALSEDVFKKAHAKELLSVDKNGVTGYPIKFDKDLGPNLDKFEAAQKAKKAADAAAAKSKVEAAIKEYKSRIDKQKAALGAAVEPLKKGLAYVEGKLG